MFSKNEREELPLPDGRFADSGVTLLVGDSIMTGRAAPLITALPGSTVQGPVVNGRNSQFNVEEIATWIAAASNPTKIIWNAGAWSCIDVAAYVEEAKYYQVTDAEYIVDLVAVARIMLDQTKNIWFVETTDIPTTNPTTYLPTNRELELNVIAKSVLIPMGIPVIDMWSYSNNNLSTHRDDQDDIHFSAAGYAAQATRIKEFIYK